MTRLIFYTRPGCHLCEQLEERVRGSLRAMGLDGRVVLSKRNVDAEPEARGEYGDRIPVVVCDGRVLMEGNPGQDEVARAVRDLAAKTPYNID